MAKNTNLNKAGVAKEDEFYTQLSDIERELRHYKEHFKDKIVFLNCDDPEYSNFWKYFELNFTFLGLKKLIATHYNAEQPTYKLELVRDENGDGEVDNLDIVMTPLEQNGDFRSPECIAILQEADIIVTNPPFSLFREYLAQLIEYDKKFLCIGTRNAITYKEVFPLLRDNKLWLGFGFNAGNAYFRVANTKEYAKGVYDEKTGLVKFRNVLWFTNLDYAERYEDLVLYKKYSSEEYTFFDNYDAINVNKVKDIPCDYYGVMGVPITIMDNHNPKQFEIVGLLAGNIKGLAGIPSKIGKDGPYINGKLKYGRILIRRKRS